MRRAFGITLRAPGLIRAELAFGATTAAEWSFTVALGIVAFLDGGPGRVAVVALLRLVPSAVLAPVATTFADRWPRDRLLVRSSTVLAVSMAGCALVTAVSGSPLVVYGLAVAATIALTPYRAAHSALLPSLCHSVDELVASNLVRGTLESLAVLLGPLVAAVLLAVGGPSAVFVAAGLLASGAGLLAWRLSYERPEPSTTVDEHSIRAAVLTGLRASVTNRDAFLLMGVAATQTFVRGALNVFVVVLAFDVLDRGDAGVGLLQAAVGLGAVAGAVVAGQMVSGRRLAAWFGGAVALWGLPIAAIGAWPRFGGAIAMLALVGLANAVLDVALFTMLGRLVPDGVLARAHGTFESMVAVAVGLGSLAAAAAIEGLGARAALAVIGAILPVLALLLRRRFRHLDSVLSVRQERLDLLQRVPMLRALPLPAVDHLARAATVRTVAPGRPLVHQGALGTAYYVVADGSVDVTDRGDAVRSLGPGEGFGEIALLRGGRRTASVRAGATAATVYRIGAEDFVRAVTGSTHALATAEALIDERTGPDAGGSHTVGPVGIEPTTQGL